MRLPARCVDLTRAHVVLAMRSREDMRKLLVHMAAIAKPAEGAAKILVLITRIASLECEWMDKAGLRVEIREGRGRTTEIQILAELDGEMRELLFPRLKLNAPRDEMVNAVMIAPTIVEPMIVTLSGDLLLLTCAEEVVGTIAPPAYEDTEEDFRKSLAEDLRMSLPPVGTFANPVVPPAPRRPTLVELDEVDSGWDAPAQTGRRPKYQSRAPVPALRKRNG